MIHGKLGFEDRLIPYNIETNSKVMKKEFGTVSSQQIREFYEIFCNFINELAEDFDESQPNTEEIQNIVSWYPLYELELNKLTNFLFHCLNLENELLIGSKKGDVLQHLLDLSKTGYIPDVPFKQYEPQKLSNFFATTICMINNFVCFSVYRTDLNQLYFEAKQGNDESLFKAINIDQSIVCSDVASKRITLALAKDEGKFFDKLSRAIKGSYPRDSSVKYPELNFFMYMIESMPGCKIDYDTLHKLFTEDLKLYPDINQSSDSHGSLRRQLERTRHKVKDMKS